jgi:DNA-binding NarL/FixJ family response regulator
MGEARRVLIADDRPHARRGLRVVLDLRPEIVIVGEAVDGEEAVQLAEVLLPDVVLMDAKLDGVEATRFIKERRPEIRVVLLTVHAGYRAEALAAGADAFLIKGCSREELLGAIIDQK